MRDFPVSERFFIDLPAVARFDLAGALRRIPYPRIGVPGWRRISVFLAALTMLSAFAPSAAAADPPWFSEPYDYVIVDQDLRDVLREFADNLGFRVQLSDEIDGQIRGDWPGVTARLFIDALARQFSFDWYYEGETLYVTARSEAEARMLALGPVGFTELESELLNLDILDARYPLRFSDESNLALVSGPPRYVELIEETLLALGKRAGADVGVFRGRRDPQS